MLAGTIDAEYIAATYSSENQKRLPRYLQIHRGAQEESSAERQALQVRRLRDRHKRKMK